MKHLFIIALLSCFTTLAKAQPETTDNLLQQAYKQAAKDNKKVFVIFHASWCGWCRKMDTSMNDPACKQFFDNNFVITHLVVKESKGKEQLENPGGLALLKKFKADSLGIPFWIIFDAKGNTLADAKMPNGENSGCPAAKEEVDHFLNVLQKTTDINKQQAEAIRIRFRKNEH